MHPVQREIYRKMSYARKLEIADQLYRTAWELKLSAVRKRHPDWPEERVERKVREYFLYAKS